jgi:hypothetical protein
VDGRADGEVVQRAGADTGTATTLIKAIEAGLARAMGLLGDAADRTTECAAPTVRSHRNRVETNVLGGISQD